MRAKLINQIGKRLEILLFIFLILVSSYLRFKNLSYSEYQDDESKAMMTIQNEKFSFSFFLSQRKGPVQFLFTRAISFFVSDWRNELFFRIPFATVNTLSVMVVWAIFKRIFKSSVTAFCGSLLYSINGFIVGFSRIVQYQNFNLLFSFLSLYFFIRLYQDKKKTYLFSALGTAFFCFSLLSHWDAIFFVIPIAYFYIAYFISQKAGKKFILATFFNLLLGCVLLLPFLIPYVNNHTKDPDSMRYFSKRVGISTYSIEKHISIFELYNPNITLYLLPVLCIPAFFKPRKNIVLVVWFVVNFLLIKFFMQKPGTHIYNYVIPIIFLSTSGLDIILKVRSIITKTFFTIVLLFLAFLTFQSYMIFVDNEPEYPWFDKEILSVGDLRLIAPTYNENEILTFGFPHFRDWKSVAEIVNNDPDDCTYITNEGIEISRIYMKDRKNISKHTKCYYVIRVKRPFNNRQKDSILDRGEISYKVFSYDKSGERLLDLYKVYLFF